MLVLKRKLGEAIIITTKSGETVEIKVSEAKPYVFKSSAKVRDLSGYNK